LKMFGMVLMIYTNSGGGHKPASPTKQEEKKMTINLVNMLEVVELVSSLEGRIEEVKKIYGKESISMAAIMSVYNQVKVSYSDWLNFKY